MNIQYVAGFVFNPDKTKVALILKNRPQWQKGRLNGIGGKIESHETPISAMVREFEEEAGVLIPADQWRHFCTVNGINWDVNFFEACGDYAIFSHTDERIDWYSIHHIRNYDHVEQLNWIIHLALDHQAKMTEIAYMYDWETLDNNNCPKCNKSKIECRCL